MAAKETVNSHRADVEATVNRWIVDYYSHLALELFRNEEYSGFCGIRDLLHNVLDRPMEFSDVMPTKIKVLQFLSRINDGENLDMSFDSDKSRSPLESALMVLENMSQACSMPLPQQDFENVCASLKDMMVAILIKNNEFDKAKEVLNKYFPKSMVGKKAIFMGLIKGKSKTHEVIEQIDFQRFKEEMLTFCQSLCPFNVPFLHKAAMQLIGKKKMEQDDTLTDPDEQDDTTTGPDEQDEAGPSSRPQMISIQFVPCKQTIIQRTRLEAAYKALAAGSDERTFPLLEEEVEGEEQARKHLPLSPTPRKDTNQDSEQDGLFQRDSGSPMEASPADQPPQTDAAPQTQAGYLSKTPSVRRNRHSHNVARLVVEPDSQGSSQCTMASKEPEPDVRTEEPPQSPAIANKKDTQSPITVREVTIPLRRLPRRANKICSSASTSMAELSADGEEDPSGSVASKESSVGKSHNQSNTSLGINSTMLELSSSDSDENPQQSPSPCKTPLRKPRKQPASDPLSKIPDAVCITDSSLDSSPELFPLHPDPQTRSTPQKDSAQGKRPYNSKWNELYSTAKESKDTWSDEESYFNSRKNTGSHNESTISNSGSRKRMWSESETQRLKEGVQKFGEGNWSKIKSYYSFKDRTNVNLKDRWRTMKKLNVV
ncbi:telomeric repeat binding factor a isoform X1 [Sebastes fasciatus]|uniref:telomeric repeat binding factor a isoform X1 n=1 Tax=Sebastes fasciatus TaxID=394691 RepID=UPI003D9F6DAE